MSKSIYKLISVIASPDRDIYKYEFFEKFDSAKDFANRQAVKSFGCELNWESVGKERWVAPLSNGSLAIIEKIKLRP